MKNPQQTTPVAPKVSTPQSWRPAYWKHEHGNAWARVREALSRDWEQTKKDVTGKGPELNQDVPDTVRQAAGTEPIPPKGQPNAGPRATWTEAEPGVRYGFGAREQYGKDLPDWNETVERKLESEWDEQKTGKPFVEVQHFVRAGWAQHRKN
jgi:hypothetical protein